MRTARTLDCTKGHHHIAAGWVQLAEALQRCLPRPTAEARAASASFDAVSRASLESSGSQTLGSRALSEARRLRRSTAAPSLPPPSKDYVMRRSRAADQQMPPGMRQRSSFSDRQSGSPLSFRTPWWSRDEVPPLSGAQQASPPRISPLRLDFLHPVPPEPASHKSRRFNWLFHKRDGKGRDRGSGPVEPDGDERAALEIQRITRGKRARRRSPRVQSQRR